MSDRYAARRAKLVRHLRSLGCERLLVTDPINVSYLTGFSGDDTLLLVTPHRTVLISDGRYTVQIAEEAFGVEAFIRPSGCSMVVAVTKVLTESSGQKTIPTLAVESDAMNLSLADALRNSLPKWDLLPTFGAVEIFRQIKDRTEIGAIRDAIRCAILGWEAVRNSLTGDMTEIEVRNDLEYAMRCAGADDRAFPSITAVGLRAALPHAVPTNRYRVADAESILFDWGAKKDFYVCDLTRVLVTRKKASKKLQKIYALVLAAQKAAIDAVRPGVTFDQVDAAARRIIEAGGFGKRFSHGIGHGLGRVVHDRLLLTPNQKNVLRPGMVVTIEPGIYLPGWGGVRIEDDVLVTRSGREVLSSRLPKEFEAMITG